MEIVEKYINNKFKEWNIRFIGLSDNADTLILGNKKSRQINGLVNEWYLEDISNNIRSAFKSKMKQGEFISPFAPFGYEISKTDNNKLVIDEVAADIVKQIYNLYIIGFGFTKIAKYLNNKNIPSPSLYKYQKGIKLNIVSNKPREEIKWNIPAIKKILTNEIYIGNLIQGKRTTISYKNHKIKNKDKNDWIKVLNTHESIIDKDTFIKVQNIIKRKNKPIKITGNIHIFSGKVFCMECNEYMRKKNSKNHEYLVCSKHSYFNNCINKSGIRYDVLIKLILDEINEKIIKYFDENSLNNLNNNKNIFIEKIKTIETQKNNIKKQIYKIDNYIKQLYEDKTNGIITIDIFKSLINNYINDKEIYINQIESINNKICCIKEKHSKNYKQVFTKYKKLEELNKVIINEFINKIYIGKINKDKNTRDIQIIWNFNT